MNQITLDLPKKSLEAIKDTMLDAAKLAFEEAAKRTALPRYLTQREASNFLNMGLSTFRNKVKPYVTEINLDGLQRWDKEDLIQFMDHNKI